MDEIKVDVDKLACGLLDLVPELGDNYEAALKLGMLPAPLMDSLRPMLSRKFDEITASQAEAADTVAALGLDNMAAEIRAELATARDAWVKETEHNVAVAMYRHASMIV